jgi:hypothetical protein
MPIWMHGACLIIGTSSLVFAYIGKILPENILPIPNFLTEKEEVGLEDVKGGIASIKRGSQVKGSVIAR